MSSNELRSIIHSLVDSVPESQLQIVYSFLEEQNKSGVSWGDLSEGERASIERGVQDANEGRVIGKDAFLSNFRRDFPQLDY